MAKKTSEGKPKEFTEEELKAIEDERKASLSTNTRK